MEKLEVELVLDKGGEKFIFRCKVGEEEKLLNVFTEKVEDDETDFDWFDAAVLSLEVSRLLLGRVNRILSF